MANREEKRNLETIPVGSLGIISLPGCKPLGEKVDQYLVKWNINMYSRPNPRIITDNNLVTIKKNAIHINLYILPDINILTIVHKERSTNPDIIPP